MESYSKAILALLKFANRPAEATALARTLFRGTLTESQYRALLAAVGAFAKDNESYFLRHNDSHTSPSGELKEQFDSWLAEIEAGAGICWLIFRKPNEPRMRAAYEVLAGWVLKFLYQTRGAIPVDYADGQARMWSKRDLPPANQLWNEFITWFPDDLLESNVSTIFDIMGGRIGTLQVPAALIPKVGLALAEMAIRHPRRFQNNIFFNVRRGLKDLAEIVTLEDLKKDDKALARQLQDDQRVKMDVKKDDKGGQKSKGGDLPKAIGCVRRVLLAKWVAEQMQGNPSSEDDLCRGLEQYRLSKNSAKQLLNDLVAFGVLERQSGTMQRGQQEINWLGLAYVQSVAAGSHPPFAFAPEPQDSPAKSRCLACGSPNVMPKAGTKMLLPESKKVWYERPKTNEPGDLCTECFFAALVSGFYPSEAYSVCELPVASAYQTFLLAQRLSNVTASLGAMAISRSALLTVLPSRYFLVRLTTGQGALPKKTQLYLLLADYSPSFTISDAGIIRAYVEAAGAINYLNIYLDVLRILNLFRRGDVLPPYFVTEGNAKVRANDAVRLLEAGKPYAALYRLLYDPFQNTERGWFGEQSLFKSPNTLETFDEMVQQGARTFLKFFMRGGESEMLIKDPEAFYQDVKDLSDALYKLLQPIAKDEVRRSGSNVSVVVRKYVEAVEKRFPQLNLVELQYMVAKAGDDAEKRQAKGESRHVHVKDKADLSKDLNDIESRVTEMYGKYFTNGNAYIWREFIKEVSQRLLARMFLGVRAAQQ